MSESPQPSASLPPAPRPPEPVRGVFVLRDARRRWPLALRAAVCMGTPVLIGWVAGDIGSGLTATIGAFTALYGSKRPYLNRSIELAIMAVTFAAAVTLGVLASPVIWAGVVTVTAIAMVAVLLCNALSVGPPGAFTITLACAAGVGLGTTHLSPWRAGLLVLAGGAVAWTVHMSGALVRPRGPEKAAVAAAGDSVADFVDALGGPVQDAARRWAAVALEESWAALVTFQPIEPRTGSTLSRLRELNHDLHRLFADAVGAAAVRQPMPTGTSQRIRQMAGQARHPGGTDPGSADTALPPGRPPAIQLVRAALSARSQQLPVVLRVGLAALVAGTIASALSLQHAYWAIVAAVLILHQGLDWTRTVQRSLGRILGTLAGLLLAGLILAAYPQGLWLVLTVVLLQFMIELVVVRNYALAVMFITPLGLVIASGGRHVADIASLQAARGIDTAIGCSVALATYWLTTRRVSVPQLPDILARTLETAARVSGQLASAAVTTREARAARRDLQYLATDLLESYEAAVGGPAGQRNATERTWPAVLAVQGLAYRMLAACWTMEDDNTSGAARARAEVLYGASGEQELDQELGALATAIRAGTGLPPPGQPPAFVRAELTALRTALEQATAR
ncbi:MAG: FUSC family protein [Actinobacteria bacterium]|nr:FUSC family protein [Actinomycetota bacterium]